MDFDLDDPLGDLLSDGSNDSFFGTSTKKTEATKTSSHPSSETKSKSKVADLFGFDNENAKKPIETTSKSNFDLNTKPNQKLPISESRNTLKREESVSNPISSRQPAKPLTPNRGLQQDIASDIRKATDVPSRTAAKKDTQFDDSDDFLNELGFDPKNPKGNIAKKSNILDDILNFSKPDAAKTAITSPKLKPTIRTPTPAPAATATETDRRGSRTVESNPPPPNRYSPSLGRPRNASRSGSGSGDPLGLFSMPAKPAPEAAKIEMATPSVKSKGLKKPTFDWLGLESENADKPIESAPTIVVSEPTKITEGTELPKAQNLANSTTILPDSIPMPSQPLNLPILTATMPATTTTDISANLNLINMASMEKEQALQSLQQQQTQLRIAAQMKHQENMLHDMHTKQQTLIKQQENQFNELLQRQINRQNQLEAQIQQQQHQINAYINVLMNQPSIGITTNVPSPDMANSFESRPNDEDDASRQHSIELEADVKRLELEKIRLEDVLHSIQSSHEQELELLQTSHKKQIALLEENLDSLEKRLRDEIKSTETYHLNKISALNTDLENQQHKYEEHIEKLIGDYEKQIERLRLNYEHDLDALKNDQRSTIESIRQSKLFEFAALQESGSYLNTLKSASDNLEQATDNLQTMRTNIDSTIERIHAEKEVQLNAREKRLNDQQKIIDKSIEKTEEERIHLIELVKSLEIKLNSIEQSSTEEQWNLRQKSATLEAEKVSFEREKTFTREKLAAEEKRIQELKEMHFAEHKRLMDLLDAEREQILIEKTKLETMEHLKPTSTPSSKRQSEVDAAIKIAQDATKSADVEREKFIEQQRRLESKRRELMEKESQLQTQQSELDMRISQARDQKQVAEHATKTCKSLEQKLLTKLQSLQDNYIELTEREAKLSQAKMELGKERMELQGVRQQLRQSKCSLCRIGAQNREISELDPLNDIDANDKPLSKLDIFSSNSFDGLQQRLSNVEAMIDDVVVHIPQSPNRRHIIPFNDSLSNANSLAKFFIDPF